MWRASYRLHTLACAVPAVLHMLLALSDNETSGHAVVTATFLVMIVRRTELHMRKYLDKECQRHWYRDVAIASIACPAVTLISGRVVTLRNEAELGMICIAFFFVNCVILLLSEMSEGLLFESTSLAVARVNASQSTHTCAHTHFPW